MKLDLEVAEVNIVLQGLIQLPYGQVAGLIAKIQDQAKEQLSDQSKGDENANS